MIFNKRIHQAMGLYSLLVPIAGKPPGRIMPQPSEYRSKLHVFIVPHSIARASNLCKNLVSHIIFSWEVGSSNNLLIKRSFNLFLEIYSSIFVTLHRVKHAKRAYEKKTVYLFPLLFCFLVDFPANHVSGVVRSVKGQ